MIAEALPVALVSAAVFGGLALMSDRPRGAFIAQGILVAGAVLVFIAILRTDGVAGTAAGADRGLRRRADVGGGGGHALPPLSRPVRAGLGRAGASSCWSTCSSRRSLA